MSMSVDQIPSESKTWQTTLKKSQMTEPTLTRKNLGRKIPTVFPGHRSLETFCDSRHEASVVLESFSAVLDSYARLPADKLIVRAFVRILESTPPTYVVNKDNVEIRVTRQCIADEVF